MSLADHDRLRLLETVDDVTPDVLAAAEETLDWFDDEPRMSTEDFIDRLCAQPLAQGWDIEVYDNPAVRKIMRHARALRRERRTL